MNEIKVHQLKRTSWHRDENTLKSHILPRIGHYRLNQLTPEIIQTQLLQNLKDSGYSYSTVHKAYVFLNAALKHAQIQNRIKTNPCDEVIAPKKKLFKKGEVRFLNYDSLVAVSGKNKETMLFIQYAEEILDWLSSTYKEKEAFIRDALETKVNHIFEQMYHGHRRVSIDQRYQVTLLTTIEDKEVAAGESEGSNRVKSFAFIAGLVALAKEKLIANAGEEGFNLSSEPYPLVMDAPFSNADETHTANISKVLPEIAEQVIMFVMQKDWRYAEPVMASRVGKQYTLKKQSETHTILE